MAACGDQFGIRVCTVAAGLRHTGRIYPRSSQKCGGGGGSVHSSCFFMYGIGSPPPETILQHIRWFVRQFDYEYDLEGLFLINPLAFSTEKIWQRTKFNISIKSLDVENPQKIPSQFTYCTENPIYVFPEKELRGLNPNSYIHVSMSNLMYIQYFQDRSTYLAAAEQKDRSRKYINLSQCRNWETEHYNSVLEIRRLHSFTFGSTYMGTRHVYQIFTGLLFAVQKLAEKVRSVR